MKANNCLACFVCAVFLACGAVAALADDYSPPPFEGRVGQITFENGSLYPVIVTLWHPDNGKAFASWKVDGQQTSRLIHDGRPINVGDSWGVQLGNAKIRPLSQFARWDKQDRMFKTSVDLFHGGE
jgi:hypothetical protein